MKNHELKTHQKVWDAVYNGIKPFEIRKNDRDFKLFDILTLIPTEEATGRPLNGIIVAKVTYVLPGGKYGIEQDYVIMAIEIIHKVDYRDNLPF